MKTPAFIIALVAGVTTAYLAIHLLESATRLSFLRALWWGIRGNRVGLTIPTVLVALMATLTVVAVTNQMMTLLLADGRGVVVVGHDHDGILVVEPLRSDLEMQHVYEVQTDVDTPAYPGQSFADLATARVILSYRHDPSYQLSVLPPVSYALYSVLAAIMVFFAYGLCVFLLSEYAGAVDHDVSLSDGAELGAAFKQNTIFPFGVWALTLITALFVLAALSIHLSRRYGPLFDEVEPFRRRMAATISETIRPGDELIGTAVGSHTFRSDQEEYAVFQIEFDDIADAPLYVNLVVQPDGENAVPPDFALVARSGKSGRYRVTDELRIEPVLNGTPVAGP